jgi:fatty acid desaturase
MTMPIDDSLRTNAEATAIAVKAKGLAGCPPGRVWFDLARTWAVIVAALAVFAFAPSFPLFVVCFVVVAAQQYALLILMHDGQHSLLHRRREINNLISKWLIGAPCGTPFFSSQKQHLTHHRTLGSSMEDPAFQFYCYGEPSPKATAGGLAMHFVKVILVSRFTYSLKGKAATAEPAKKSLADMLREYLPILLAQGLIFLAFSLAGIWWGYFLLWALPLVTLVSFFDAFRQFAEHANPTFDSEAGSRLISTQSNAFERFFFAPFGMNFHAEHHLFPFVPYSRLPELSQLLRGSAEAEKIHWRSSYFSSLSGYVRGLQAVQATQS